MKISFEDYLHKIDQSLKEKKQQELYMTYAMVVMGIFAFAYFLFWDSSSQEFEKTRKSVVMLQKKISGDKQYLQRNSTARIIQLTKQIQSINKDVQEMQKTNNYIKSKIESIPSLIYDEQTWGEYLDSIATNAQKYHVKLIDFTNRYAKSHSSFGHVLDVYIHSKGNFQKSLEFINSLEKSDLVVDIHDFQLDAKDKLEADLNLSVWGIRY